MLIADSTRQMFAFNESFRNIWCAAETGNRLDAAFTMTTALRPPAIARRFSMSPTVGSTRPTNRGCKTVFATR